jgi:uncharacterized protein
MDYATKFRIKQVAVSALVALAALLANLPKEWAERLNLNAELLIGILGLLIVLALFLFARFSYFFLTVLLIAGANLPDRWALGLHIDKLPLMMALGIMITVSLANRLAKFLPTGLEPKPKSQNADGIHALMTAASRGQDRTVRRLIDMNIELNSVDETGRTPLMLAAAAGHAKIVEMLVEGGANVEIKNPDGLTAMQLATQVGKVDATESIQEALIRVNAPAPAASRLGSWKSRDRRTWL